jgi:hypothetical protein
VNVQELTWLFTIQPTVTYASSTNVP